MLEKLPRLAGANHPTRLQGRPHHDHDRPARPQLRPAAPSLSKEVSLGVRAGERGPGGGGGQRGRQKFSTVPQEVQVRCCCCHPSLSGWWR